MLPADATFEAGVQLAVDALYESGVEVNRRILDHADPTASMLAIQLLRIVARAGMTAISERGDDADAHVADIVRKAASLWHP